MSLRKVTPYKACICPIMPYALVVFDHSKHVQKLQIVQNRFLRKATGSLWFVRNVDLHRDMSTPKPSSSKIPSGIINGLRAFQTPK